VLIRLINTNLMNDTPTTPTLAPWLAPGVLTPEQATIGTRMLEVDQGALFESWEPPGVCDEDKLAFLDQLVELDHTLPGGLIGYIDRGRVLLDDQSQDSSEVTGLEKPTIVDLTKINDRYLKLESLGLENADKAAFVLVAGGVGERLGYDGIKMQIPFEITSGTTYMQLYCETILAIQQRISSTRNDHTFRIPFLIMTSDGTHERLASYLQEHAYFGLDPKHVHVFEQNLVPALKDRDAHLATDGRYKLLLKPGGHGDVHLQLHRRGYARMLKEMGKTHIVFLQDTNAQVVNLILPALGASCRAEFAFNFVCVPRVPGEPIGGVVNLTSGGSMKTLNIEYNQLDAFLKSQGLTGDEPDDTGFSPYPGNINLLVVRLEEYIQVLERTGGAVAEFINPKYADEASRSFASPTRIETLMQDLAGSYPSGTKIGATLFDRDWALAAMKNSLATAAAKARAGEPTYSAAAAEAGFYRSQRLRLTHAGMQADEGGVTPYHGVPFRKGAHVVLSPAYALTLSDLRDKVDGGHLGEKASLVVKGIDVYLRDVRLAGRSTLIINACAGATVYIEGLILDRQGYMFEPLTDRKLEDAQVPAHLKIRGYRCVMDNRVEYNFDQPGDFHIGPDGVVGHTETDRKT